MGIMDKYPSGVGGITPEQGYLLTGAQQKSEKGLPSGYVGIDADGGVSVNGSVRSEINTFEFSNSHRMFAAGQELFVENTETGIFYSPAWSGVSGSLDIISDPTTPIWLEKFTDVDLYGPVSGPNVGAEWVVTSTINATFNSITLIIGEPTGYFGELTLEVESVTGKRLFKSKKTVSLNLGDPVFFDYSSDGILYRVREGDQLGFVVYKGDGSPLLVAGASSVSAGLPYVRATYRKFKDSAVIAVDPNGKIPSKYLPGGVQTIVEVPTYSALPPTGAVDTLYVTLDTSIQYLWGGTSYVVVPIALALGENAQTAYRGDRGKTAYDHSQSTGNPHGTTIAHISGLQAAIDGMGLRKIGAFTATANAKLSADNIFTSAYENYRVIIEWTMSGASGTYNNFIRFRTAGVANSTANYGLAGAYSGPFSGTPSNNGQTSFTGVMNHTGTTDCTCRVVMDIIYPQKPVVTSVTNAIARYRYDSNTYYSVWWAGQFDANTVFDGLEVNAASGTFSSAKMTVYAYT